MNDFMSGKVHLRRLTAKVPYDALDDEHVKKMFDILRMRLGVLVLDDEVIKWAANEEYDDSLNGFLSSYRWCK